MIFANKVKLLAICLTFSSFTPLSAAEVRQWTSAKGTVIEAKLQKIEGNEVLLITPEAKVIKVKITDLSLADKAHLVDFADADKKILVEGKLTVPEEDIRFNKKTLKSLEQKMGFGDESIIEFDLLESEHFLIASTGRFRSQPLAEMAERLWHGMAFQHMNFREDWGDKKKVVIVTTDDEIYQALGLWYSKWLLNNIPDEARAQKASADVNAIWNHVAGTTIQLPEDQQEKFNAFDSARIFRISDGDDQSYKKVFGAFPTHGLASILLDQQMGGVSDISPDGYFAITTGHAFFKEIQLAGKSETQLLNPGDYDDDEITSASGFKDGRSWAKSLRKLVRQNKVVPDVEKLLAYESRDLTPEKLVLIYSFAYYLQSNPERIAAFAKMVTRIESNNQVPASIEIAKIYGFETIEEFQADWVEFVKSSNFK